MAIAPDTKDWTWVLDRPCSECGFDPAAWAAASIAPEVLVNAGAWTAVLERPTARVRPSETRWSDLEYACHVRDVHRVFDARLSLLLDVDEPIFENWDQDATAAAERYESQDPAVVSGELVAAARTYAHRLGAVAPDQWSRRGTRSNASPFSVETLARYALHDVAHHLWDVGARSSGPARVMSP